MSSFGSSKIALHFASCSDSPSSIVSSSTISSTPLPLLFCSTFFSSTSFNFVSSFVNWLLSASFFIFSFSSSANSASFLSASIALFLASSIFFLDSANFFSRSSRSFLFSSSSLLRSFSSCNSFNFLSASNALNSCSCAFCSVSCSNFSKLPISSKGYPQLLQLDKVPSTSFLHSGQIFTSMIFSFLLKGNPHFEQLSIFLSTISPHSGHLIYSIFSLRSHKVLSVLVLKYFFLWLSNTKYYFNYTLFFWFCHYHSHIYL